MNQAFCKKEKKEKNKTKQNKRACLKHEMAKWRNDEIAKWRNGTKDKSHSYKILPFLRNLHLLPNLFCGLSPQIKETPMQRRDGLSVISISVFLC